MVTHTLDNNNGIMSEPLQQTFRGSQVILKSFFLLGHTAVESQPTFQRNMTLPLSVIQAKIQQEMARKQKFAGMKPLII
jgi:hypothetical protein